MVNDREGPDGDAPEPAHWPAPTWDESREWHRPHDMYLAHAIAWYLREGNPYAAAYRNEVGVKWLGLNQRVFFIRIDDGNALSRIADRLKNQRDGTK